MNPEDKKEYFANLKVQRVKLEEMKERLREDEVRVASAKRYVEHDAKVMTDTLTNLWKAQSFLIRALSFFSFQSTLWKARRSVRMAKQVIRNYARHQSMVAIAEALLDQQEQAGEAMERGREW